MGSDLFMRHLQLLDLFYRYIILFLRGHTVSPESRAGRKAGFPLSGADLAPIRSGRESGTMGNSLFAFASRFGAVLGLAALVTVSGCNKFFDTETTVKGAGATKVDTSCPPNMYFKDNACTPCLNGIVVGQTECSACKTGEVVVDGRCDRCIGSIVSGNPHNTCVACSANQTWSPTKGCVDCVGQVVDGSCQSCAKNQVWNGFACEACNGMVVNGACVACADGTYFNGQACAACNGATKDGVCNGCKVGQILENNECKDCSGVVYAGHCISCDKPGEYFNGVACTKCLTGPVVAGQCSACAPTETFNGTACVPCTNGQVVNGQCVTCSALQTWNPDSKVCENCIGKVVGNECQACTGNDTFVPGVGCQACAGVAYQGKCYRCDKDETLVGGVCTHCSGTVANNTCTPCAGVVLNNQCIVCDASKNEYVGADAKCHTCKGVAGVDNCADCPEGQYWTGTTCTVCQGRLKNTLTCEPCTSKEIWKEGVGCVADDRRKNFCLEVFPTSEKAGLNFSQADADRIGILRVQELNWPWAEWHMTRLPGTPGSRTSDIGYVARGDFFATKSAPHDFRVCADDGARLVINGQKVIDMPNKQMGTCADTRVNLVQGANSFEITYFQGPARHAQFQWLRKVNGQWVPVSGDSVEACDPTKYALPGLFPKITEVRETYDVCHSLGWPGTVTRTLKAAPVSGINIPEIKNHVVGAFTYPSYCYNSGYNPQENHVDIPNGCGDEHASIFNSSIQFSPSDPTVTYKTAVAWNGGKTCHFGQITNVLYQIQADMNKVGEILGTVVTTSSGNEIKIEKDLIVPQPAKVTFLSQSGAAGSTLLTPIELPTGYTINKMSATWTQPKACSSHQRWLTLTSDKRNATYGTSCPSSYGQVRLKVTVTLKK